MSALTRGRTPLLRPPRLRTEAEDGERHATWFELFFDLVFVVAVAQLAHELATDASALGFLRFVFLFAPVWWSWVVFTLYADRFDTDDTAYRLLGMLGMLAIVVLGVTLHGAMPTARDARGDLPFALAYLGVRAVSVLLYVRASRHVPIAKALVRIHGANLAASAVLWLPALLLPAPERYAVWGVALVLEMVVTPIVVARTLRQAPVSAFHLPERFGLLVMIVIGESVVAVATGLAETEWHVRSALIAVAAFGLAGCLWWIHFDFVAARSLRRRFLERQVFVFGHFPIVVGLTAMGAGALLAIEHASDASLDPGARWAHCGGLALYLVAIAGIILAGMEHPLRQLAHFRATATLVPIALALAAFGGDIPPLAFVVTLLTCLSGLVGLKLAGMTAPRTETAADHAHGGRTTHDGTSPERPLAR